MSFSSANALASPLTFYAPPLSYSDTLDERYRDTPDWLRFIDDLVGAVDKGFDIYERIDYPAWKRARDELALERERRLREEARADQTQAATPTPAWVWVALGVGGVAAVLLILNLAKD